MIILVLAGALLMRLGLVVYAAGSVRSKNVASVLGRNVLDWTIGLLVFWAVGGAIASQSTNAYLGLHRAMLLQADPDGFGVIYYGLLSLFGSIVLGATAERSRLWPMLLLTVVAAAIVYPIAQQWSSFGWLFKLGFIDKMGAGSVHVAGAAMAAVAVWFVGPRNGKYHRDGSTSMIPGHSLPMILGGAWLTALGCLVMIGGRGDVPHLVINILLSAAASVLACAAFFQIRYAKIDLPVLAAALIGGVVAISAGGESVYQPAAVIIGAVAGLLVSVAMVKLDTRLKLDDVTGAVSIHGIAGAWGLIAAGIFRNDDVVNRTKSVTVQIGGLLAIAILSAVVTTVTLAIIARFASLTSKEADEFDGLDLAEHDVGSYPDFQQNTIKSFHLREQ